MLSDDDQVLASRDAALPGLAQVLDPAFVLDHLRRHGAELPADTAVRGFYIRYKPATSCLVAYRLEGPDPSAFVTLRLHRSADRDKAAKPLSRPDPVRSFGLVPFLSETPLLLTLPFPNDHELKPLCRLEDPCTRQRLLAGLLPAWTDEIPCRLQPLAYKPERRFVARLQRAGGDSAVLRLYDRRSFARSAASHQLQASLCRSAGPQLLAVDAQRRAIVSEWIPGQPLSAGPASDAALFATLGASLARFHRDSAAATPPQATASFLARLQECAADLEVLLPEQQASLSLLVQRLQQACAAGLEQPGACCLIHGDFSPDQVVLTPQGPRLIDFDRARLSHALHDLASFLARLEADHACGRLAREDRDRLSPAFLAGYLSGSTALPRALVAPLVAAQLFLLASEPFRQRAPAWRSGVTAILERVWTLLERDPYDV
ncbi:MAG: aminoglycoside phosphotransferase family protein [Synechococcaceae cyanobacterium]|nr:aminoglycoside phosphotransferase family protein [Synechococcaceae cyanobacterium]